jgi:hypothetical protein
MEDIMQISSVAVYGMIKRVIFVLTIILVAAHCKPKEHKAAEVKTLAPAAPAETLIYSDSAMKNLRLIADSIAGKCSNCTPWKDFISVQQAQCHYISIDTGNIKAAMADMLSGATFENICRKYPLHEPDKDVLVIAYKFTDYDNERKLTLRTVPIEDFDEHLIYKKGRDTNICGRKLKGKWIIDYTSPSDNFPNGYLEAFYVTEDFKTVTLPGKYSRAIQYADCLTDTSVQVFTPLAYKNNTDYIVNRKRRTRPAWVAIQQLHKYVYMHTYRPVEADFHNGWDYYHAAERWEKSKDSLVEQIAAEPLFLQLLNEASKKGIEYGFSDEDLDNWTEKYVSKRTALQLRRNHIVSGSCSRDTGPQNHAKAMARLAAETGNWSIFLRCQLDILNDKFDRVSDAGYAESRRKTYIRELEVLPINVNDLLLGVNLQIANPSGYHYSGSVGRTGRALAESAHLDEMEKMMTAAMADSQLDDYNRMRVFYLYRSCLYYVTDSVLQAASIKRFKTAVSTLPPYLSFKIKINDSDFNKR